MRYKHHIIKILNKSSNYFKNHGVYPKSHLRYEQVLK